MTERKGCIEDIIFYNEENGYLVAAVSDESGEEGIVTGNLPMAREGSTWREILSHYYPGTELSALPV